MLSILCITITNNQYIYELSIKIRQRIRYDLIIRVMSKNKKQIIVTND